MHTTIPLLQQNPYIAYTYAYPHKTAYRPFPQPLPLGQIWADEPRNSIFLYIHVPFCEMRCGFCNLFTTVDHHGAFAADYISALQRQAEQVRASIGPVQITRMAIGGGTPTQLPLAELARLFEIADRFFATSPATVPTSVETSPMTAEPAKLQLLRERGVERISIGVQSFIEAEAHAAGRPQQARIVEKALATIRATGFPILNIDLIYGLPGQTVESWLTSLRAALRYQPEELYLYPLYVRPLTGLARREERQLDRQAETDIRLECYRRGRELLLAAGYTQVSMRMFRAAHAPAETGPVYCMQDDGMIGLGCGARSYTRRYHYSTEYAVGAQGVRAILARYLATPSPDFALAHYGFQLNIDEQQRRYILKSLLEAGKLDTVAYRQRFLSEASNDHLQLRTFLETGMVQQNGDMLSMTPIGLERSDALGPWLYSDTVHTLMGGFELQ